MTQTQRISWGQALAGTNQYRVFSAVVQNFGQAVKASDEALNSQGTTLKQNEKLL